MQGSRKDWDLMSDQSEFMEVFLDVLPNHPKNDQMRENFKHMLREKFENTLPDAVERIWELPPILLQKRSREYVGLLMEARSLHRWIFLLLRRDVWHSWRAARQGHVPNLASH